MFMESFGLLDKNIVMVYFSKVANKNNFNT